MDPFVFVGFKDYFHPLTIAGFYTLMINKVQMGGDFAKNLNNHLH